VRFSRLSVVLLLAFSWLTTTGSRGQHAIQVPGSSEPHWPPGQRSILDISGVFVDPVPNAPFSATVDIVSEQDFPAGNVHALRTTERIARDSQGRTYSEEGRQVPASTTGQPPIDTILIYDRVAGLELLVNPYALGAKQRAVPPPAAAPGNVPAETNAKAGGPITSEDLGTKIYENLVLKGVRQSRPSGVVDEYWYSPELSIYVIRTHQEPKLKETVTVTHIDRSDPDPSKFTIPKGYTVIYGPGGGVTAPQLTHSVDPQFSDEARRAKFGGIFVVALIVDTQGMPQDVHVVKSVGKGLDEKGVEAVGKGLDEKAVEAVKQYRFKPAMYEGHPVQVEINVEVNFRTF
jgi:TonB family protein